MSLGDWEEGKKSARGTMGSSPRIYCYYYYYCLFFLLEYPTGDSMEERATETLKLSNFTTK